MLGLAKPGVGAEVGDADGVGVGEKEGEAVGTGVRAAVGTGVGGVGDAVGSKRNIRAIAVMVAVSRKAGIVQGRLKLGFHFGLCDTGPAIG